MRSSSSTTEAATAPRRPVPLGDSTVHVVLHPHNRGKGAAVRTGLAQVTGDLVLIQDADLEYDPDDWPKLLAPILKGRAEVVYGTRFTGERRNMLFLHWIGNRFLSLLTNVLYNTTLSDMETCYKLFDRELIDSIDLRSERFDFEPEITAKILRRGIRIYEVPISYSGREFDEGKKITWQDGVVAVKTLIKYRFTSDRPRIVQRPWLGVPSRGPVERGRGPPVGGAASGRRHPLTSPP